MITLSPAQTWAALLTLLITVLGFGLWMCLRTEAAAIGVHEADPDHTDYQARFEADEKRGA